MPQASHQLAAIMFTDIVGYTALMGADVESGLEQLRKNRHIHQLLTEKYYGKFLKEMGDGTLLQFNSTIDAIQCALEIQQRARDELKVKIRIGIHLGWGQYCFPDTVDCRSGRNLSIGIRL
jgi:adenylate cyclase